MNTNPSHTEPLLFIDDVTVEYPGKKPRTSFQALSNVSMTIEAGETLGLVGESGSGKTTLGRAVLGLAPVTGGSIRFDGRTISGLNRRQRRVLSSDIQVVFQDPYSSLNPMRTVMDILAEPLLVTGTRRREAEDRITELLDYVYLPADAATRLPSEFSGGQRQRIAIARALCRDPRLIICDEPVSALDLTTQARVLDLFVEIQERTGIAYLFVTHDLSVVRHVSHRVAVMHRGQIVETGASDKVTSTPDHPYTQQLLLSAPVPDPARQAQRREDRQRFLAAQATGEQR